MFLTEELKDYIRESFSPYYGGYRCSDEFADEEEMIFLERKGVVYHHDDDYFHLEDEYIEEVFG